MKKCYMQILVASMMLLGTTTLFAQIPNDSPIPVDVFVEIPSESFEREITDYTSLSSIAEWGTDALRQTVTGEMIWVDDDDILMDGLDSLGCDTTTMVDYTDKIVLVRRGECFFSDKIYYAQQAGAIGVIIINADGSDPTGGMAPGDEKALDVVIPAVFFNVPGDGASFIPQLEAGIPVIASFRVRGFFGELGPNAYATPQNQVRPMDSIQVELLNLDAEEPLLDATATVTITDPNGVETAFTSSVDTIRPDEIHVFEFDDYTPADIGTYNMEYTNSVSTDVITRTFEVSERTFQMDNGNIPEWPVDSWIANTEETFIDTDLLIYDFGNLFKTGDNPDKATYASFSLGNPDTLFTGSSSADVITITLFDTDPDGDGVGPEDTHMDYSNYEVVGEVEYVLTGEEEPYEVITVAFEEAIDLKANGQYLLMERYDGAQSLLGKSPWYTYAGTEPYPAYNTMRYNDRLYPNGWGGDFHAVVRLHLEGFSPISSAYSPLATNAFTLAPNPAKEVINFSFDLIETASEMQIRIVDMTGKVHLTHQLDNVKAADQSFNVSQLPAGMYLFVVNTPNGHKTQKFVVGK
jgi:hypothetical protein